MKTTASNFELNVLKLGIHTFQLEKGDRFESNGSYFHYVPHNNSPNKGKGKRVRYSGRQNYHSAVKYQKDVMKAENIELIEDKLQFVDSQGKERRHYIWEVKYAYKIDLPKNENIVLLSIELGNKYINDQQNENEWAFKTVELEVERVTEKQYFLKQRDPIAFNQRLDKSDLNNVRVRHNNEYYVFCLMENYNEQEIKLFQYVEKAINEKIENGKTIVRVQTNNLNKFQELKSKQGY